MVGVYILIYTSNFARCGNHANAVSIALKPPEWYKGREYKRLAPPFWLLQEYHNGLPKEDYELYYYSEVLSHLNPCEVVHAIGDGSIILCWESASDFCHRHLVSGWINKELGIEVEEYIDNSFLNIL